MTLGTRGTRRASALLVAFAIAAGGCGRSDGTIAIGLAGPFTDPVGLPMRLAAELAVDEINAAGGIGGRKLELIERDDFGNADTAVVVANELYQSPAVAVVGDVFSDNTLASAPVYNGGSHPVVQISPASSSPYVTDAGPYTFRVCPSDLAHGAALARWAHENLRFSRGAVLYLNKEYGRGVRQTFVEEFTRLQGEVVETDPYLGDTPNVAPYMDRLARRQNAQFVLVAGNRSEAEQALREARSRNMKIPFLGADGLEGIEAAGRLAEGTYVSAAYMAALKTPKNQAFLDAYRRKYPSAALPNQPAAATYDAIYLLRDVIARVGTERPAVRDGVAAVGTTAPAFEGVTGTIAFDENGDVPNQRVVIGLVRNGTVQPAEGQ